LYIFFENESRVPPPSLKTHRRGGHETKKRAGAPLAFYSLSLARESKESLQCRSWNSWKDEECGQLDVLMNIDERSGWKIMGKDGHLARKKDRKRRFE
jgi:hypothetical protein